MEHMFFYAGVPVPMALWEISDTPPIDQLHEYDQLNPKSK